MKRIRIYLYFLCFILMANTAIGFETPITIFPLDRYDQNIENWIKPSDADYNELLISSNQQQIFCHEFYNHYFSTGDDAFSPWSRKHVEQEIRRKIPQLSEKTPVVDNGNSVNIDVTKEIYGENFQPYSTQWISNIITNINLKQFKEERALKYNPNKRGIVIRNLLARSLPTIEPGFYKPTLPGEGYPFDNLQESSVWIGTPVYIIGKSLDEQWSLILTPHIIAWVPSDGIAKASEAFIKEWQDKAKRKMIAITRTDLSILDEKKQYKFNVFVGTVFPGVEDESTSGDKSMNILIPVMSIDHDAQIVLARVNAEDAVPMPLNATPHNFSTIISALIGRPYGWGNVYFYNDCSSELQNLYVPFGVWLPRQTFEQAKVGISVDKTSKSVEKRLKYLIENGKKFTTIIYICGHVMLYIGNYPNQYSKSSTPIAMTYQNIWGLRPINGSYRAVIGKSILFPLLVSYPEDQNLLSLADRKCFRVIYLNEFKNNEDLYLSEDHTEL